MNTFSSSFYPSSAIFSPYFAGRTLFQKVPILKAYCEAKKENPNLSYRTFAKSYKNTYSPNAPCPNQGTIINWIFRINEGLDELPEELITGWPDFRKTYSEHPKKEKPSIQFKNKFN